MIPEKAPENSVEEKKRQEGIVDENPLGFILDEEIKMEDDKVM